MSIPETTGKILDRRRYAVGALVRVTALGCFYCDRNGPRACNAVAAGA